MTALLSVDVKDVFGADAKKLIVSGLEEAVERCAKTGQFSWMHIVPLLNANGGDPDVSSCRDSVKFASAATVMLSQAASALADRAEAEAQEPEPEQDGTEKQEAETKAPNVGLEWLRALLYCSPNMNSFRDLLDDKLISDRIELLQGIILQKVAKYSFPTKMDVTALADIIRGRPELQGLGVRLATELLGNKEIDYFTTEVLDFVQGLAIQTDGEDSSQVLKSRELGLLDAAKSCWILAPWLSRVSAAQSRERLR